MRGVDIDLIRGMEANDESLDWLKKLAYDCREKIGRIRFNHEVSFINTNMMIWDEDSQVFKGVMGTHNWLSCAKSPEKTKRKLDISIILSNSRLVSCFAWCAAALWPRGPEQNLSSIPDKWRRIAANLEDKWVASNDRNGKTTNYATIKVVQDSEHKRLFREMCNSAQLRILIATSILDDSYKTAVSWISERDHSEEFEYKILYGETDMTQAQIDSLTGVRQS